MCKVGPAPFIEEKEDHSDTCQLKNIHEDLTLIVSQGVKIRVNRSIFATRCPFFAAMLGRNSRKTKETPKSFFDESNNNRSILCGFAEGFADEISLPEVSANSLQHVKHYLNTGRIDALALKRDCAAAAVANISEHVVMKEDKTSSISTTTAPSSLEGEEIIITPTGTLAVDGYIEVQSLLHLCSLWSLDHCAALIEALILDDLPNKTVPEELAIPMIETADQLGNIPVLKAHCLRVIRSKIDSGEFTLSDISHDNERLQDEIKFHVIQSLLL